MDKAWEDMKRAKEEEYFMKKEKELLKKREEEKRIREEQRKKELTHMKCPKCGESLKEVAFQNILIDQCTGCSGVWLDPGELEALARQEEGSWVSRFFKNKG